MCSCLLPHRTPALVTTLSQDLAQGLGGLGLEKYLLIGKQVLIFLIIRPGGLSNPYLFDLSVT